MLRYDLIPADPAGHIIEVRLTVPEPDPQGQKLTMPAWISGSYLLRDFARHVVDIGAQCKGEPVAIWPLDKDSWQCAPCDGPLEVFYQVYANDLSVRGAHFDTEHCFFNGTSVFLLAEGQRDRAVEVVLHATPYVLTRQWEVATTLPRVAVDEHGFGGYRADSYDHLIEHPVEMGQLQWLEFEAGGVPHRMAIQGGGRIDLERIARDLQPICQAQIDLFGEAPFDEYLFLVTVTRDGYGGLEHPDSTALICSREMLPAPTLEKADKAYLDFLELCSHEYFHAWNVKRIRPACFNGCDLTRPVYTHLLWWFEGATSYYDLLFLYRAGLIDRDTYLDRLAQQLTRVWRMPGRFRQSVAESSLLTWTKFYQQDENAPNAIISYYTKGAAIVLGLDLLIRRHTRGERSLDDLMRQLWQLYGREGVGIEADTIEVLASEVAGHDLNDYFQQVLYGTEDVPLETLFPYFGIRFSLRPATGMKDLGGRTDHQTRFPPNLGIQAQNTPHNRVRLTHVWNDRPAYHGGLAAGDELIALDWQEIRTVEELEKLLQGYRPGESVEISYFRGDRLHNTLVTLDAPPADRVLLEATEAENRLAWP